MEGDNGQGRCFIFVKINDTKACLYLAKNIIAKGKITYEVEKIGNKVGIALLKK